MTDREQVPELGQTSADKEQPSPLHLEPGGQAAHFYRAFADRFRGSRELIQSRLRVYLPFIEPLKSIADHPTAVDLGCGRGEWLELLAENGFDAQGVDLDEEMVAASGARGLRVANEDAVAFLKALPNDSQSIVSGFHIAEHLPFAELQSLVEQALRVLKPAGLLILETPNPENIRVASLDFYVDPFHRNPLPPRLLSFLPEYFGFQRTKVIRLQESHDLLQSQAASLRQVLGGASPDYAVIAQKTAATDVTRLFDGEFNKDFGLSADDLIGRFDRRLEAGLDGNAAKAAELARTREALATSEALAKALETDLRANAAWAKSLQSHLVAKSEALALHEAELARVSAALADRDAELARVGAVLAIREAEIARAAAALAANDAELRAMRRSTSWRITAPIRGFSRAARWLARGMRAWLTFTPGSRPYRVAHRLRTMLLPMPPSQPDIPNLVSDDRSTATPANAAPTVNADAVADVRPQDLPEDLPAITATPVQTSSPSRSVAPHASDVEDVAQLAPSARLTYGEIKAAIAKRVGRR